MAAIIAILAALGRLVWRDLGSFRSVHSNNFFIFVVILAMQPASAAFFMLILGGIVFVLISEDPLRKLGERIRLWPLTTRQRLLLRVAAFALSPVAWLALGVVMATGRFRSASPVVMAALLAQVPNIAIGAAIGRVPSRLTRITAQTSGALTGLVMLHLRQMLTLLDTYLAALLSLAGMGARVVGRTDPAAFPVLAMLVALALSTHTQALFGLDGIEGRVRYRLYPIAGWRILAAKSMAYLLVVGCLTAPLDLGCGLSSGLAALVLGHYKSVLQWLPQQRWRFAEGTLIPMGFIQIVVVFMAGAVVRQAGPVWMLVPALGCVISTWFYSRKWDRHAM